MQKYRIIKGPWVDRKTGLFSHWVYSLEWWSPEERDTYTTGVFKKTTKSRLRRKAHWTPIHGSVYFKRKADAEEYLNILKERNEN